MEKSYWCCLWLLIPKCWIPPYICSKGNSIKASFIATLYLYVTGPATIPWRCAVWPDLWRPTTYAHNDKGWFLHSFISMLSNQHNTTAKSWLVCFLWSLFLLSLRCPQVLGCLLNVTGWLVQAATLLEITNWLVDDIDHGLRYILWNLEYNGTLV